MALIPKDLRANLDSLVRSFGPPARILLAWSGGRDSTVLLQLMSEWVRDRQTELHAVHINHGLHDSAHRWQAHCEALANELGIVLLTLPVDVSSSGMGVEASARTARYNALQSLMKAGDWLLTAHHEDDQAETVLLNLMRGSGVSGLRGTALARRLGPGLLVRPLLNISAQDIDDYARAHNLAWIEDHSNSDQRHDRNYLRAVVLPGLRERWPGAARSLARSASHAREAASLLDQLALLDIAVCGEAGRLSIASLLRFPAARQRNLIRGACHVLALRTPPFKQMKAIQDGFLSARIDSKPLIAWDGVEVRRYRDHIYLTAASGPLIANDEARLSSKSGVSLGRYGGTLSLVASGSDGIREATAASGLQIRFRQGGERLRPSAKQRNRRLKSLLQEAGIVPWMRDRIPLLYDGSKLVAVGDLWIAAEYQEPRGFSVHWARKPALF